MHNSDLPRSRRSSVLEQAAIYGICIVNLMYNIPSVAIADMVEEFAPVSQGVITTITMSVPCLTALLGINLIPVLQSRFSLKKITMAALVVAVLAGIIALLWHKSLAAILIASIVMGLSYGVFCTMYPLLAAVGYPEKEALGRVMAGCTAMVQVGRVITMSLSGLLADIAWHLIYLLCGLNILVLLMVYFFLPDRGITPRRAKGSSGCYVQLFKSGSFLYLGITAALYLILYYTVATYVSVYVQGYNLGVPSTTGTLSSLASGTAIFTALLSARIYKVTGRYTSALAFLGMGIALILPGIHRSLPAIACGLILASVVKSQHMPTVMKTISTIKDERLRTSAMALKETFVNIGYFLSPAITAGLGQLFGDGSAASVYFGSGAAALIVGLFMLGFEIWREKRNIPVLSV